mmetsp:Transcript_12521/g.41045  ORF Transcript_12521/g.41045 Transcript_12521/m.41045 type:complete len:269 (+) Transcript_12521:3522-4328(+)|eukprot:scaffold9409_cov116-Isochrysis_galbana.AAC.14
MKGASTSICSSRKALRRCSPRLPASRTRALCSSRRFSMSCLRLARPVSSACLASLRLRFSSAIAAARCASLSFSNSRAACGLSIEPEGMYSFPSRVRRPARTAAASAPISRLLAQAPYRAMTYCSIWRYETPWAWLRALRLSSPGPPSRRAAITLCKAEDADKRPLGCTGSLTTISCPGATLPGTVMDSVMPSSVNPLMLLPTGWPGGSSTMSMLGTWTTLVKGTLAVTRMFSGRSLGIFIEKFLPSAVLQNSVSPAFIALGVKVATS